MSKQKKTHSDGAFPPGFLFACTASAGAISAAVCAENPAASSAEKAMAGGGKKIGRAAFSGEICTADFDLARKFCVNSTHLTLSWAQLQPGENEFDPTALNRIKSLLTALKDRNIGCMLSVCGENYPAWFLDSGSWNSSTAVKDFSSYVTFVTAELGELSTHWIPISNSVSQAYDLDSSMDRRRSFTPFSANSRLKNLRLAHQAAQEIIHSANPNTQVGLSVRASLFEPEDSRSAWDLRAARRVMRVFNRAPLEDYQDSYDFLALSLGYNYKTRFDLFRIGDLYARNTAQFRALDTLQICDEAITLLRKVLKMYTDFTQPIYISSCGFPTDNDTLKTHFINGALDAVLKAIADGMDIKGYFHHSLLDETNPQNGDLVRSGLIHVDNASGARTPNPSLSVYGEIARQGSLSKTTRAEFSIQHGKDAHP